MAGTAITHADVLAVFERDAGTPLTAPEVAEAVGCARRTAHKKLEELAGKGALDTKKVGARGRVWWRPRPDRTGTRMETATATGTETEPESDDPPDVDRSALSSEHRDPARALRDLHDASRDLMRAERRERIGDVAVTAAESILGLSLCGLWLHDPEGTVLDPVAWTESGVEEYGKPPAFPVGDSLVGETFREGTYRKYDDVRTADGVYDPATRVRSELILPLGGHGVLNASSPEPGVFDEVDVSLGRILAANVETALDRADRLEERRARRRELRRQRDELETLNRINTLVEETIGALVEAATREQIETTVCERLAGSQFYVDAWIVERDPDRGVTVRSGADGPGDQADPFGDRADHLSASTPVVTAIEEATMEVVPRIDGDDRIPDSLQSAASARGARACLVVPLTYADTVFGALVVHAPEPDAFSDRELAAFGTLGRVVGFAINATNNRQLLLGTTAVEIETVVRNAWFLGAARRLEAPVAVEGLVPTDDAGLIEYVTVERTGDARPADVADLPAVADVRVLSADDDRYVLECAVRESHARLATVVEYGATVRSARADRDTGRVTTRFPSSTAARDAVAVVEAAFPDAELVAKRVVDLSDRSVATIRQTVAQRLTDKQLAALRAAFLAGYYDSPRGTTGRELADSLDVAPSTLHQHLQAASRKLLATVFDELS